MRTLTHACISFIVSVALIIAPVLVPPADAASAPLGVILQAQKAQVGADITAGGATVYDGDRLQTDPGGAIRAQLGGPQLFLRQDTNALVHPLANGFSAELDRGTVVVSATKGQAFELVADGATIRPAGTQGTVAQVTKVNDKELLLTSSRGALEVAMNDEVKTIDSGTSYRMEVESTDPGPQPPQAGPYHTARNHFVLFAIIAVSAATTILIWRVLVSPDAPTNLSASTN